MDWNPILKVCNGIREITSRYLSKTLFWPVKYLCRRKQNIRCKMYSKIERVILRLMAGREIQNGLSSIGNHGSLLHSNIFLLEELNKPLSASECAGGKWKCICANVLFPGPEAARMYPELHFQYRAAWFLWVVIPWIYLLPSFHWEDVCAGKAFRFSSVPLQLCSWCKSVELHWHPQNWAGFRSWGIGQWDCRGYIPSISCQSELLADASYSFALKSPTAPSA